MSIKIVNDVDGLISAAHKAGATFNEAFHVAAFNCVHLSDANGDVRPLNRLFEKLTPAAANALKSWAVHFAAVKYDPDVKGFKVNKAREVSDEMKAERETVGPMEYVRAAKPKTVTAFNLVTELRKLRDKAEKHNCNGPAMVHLAAAINA